MHFFQFEYYLKGFSALSMGTTTKPVITVLLILRSINIRPVITVLLILRSININNRKGKGVTRPKSAINGINTFSERSLRDRSIPPSLQR